MRNQISRIAAALALVGLMTLIAGASSGTARDSAHWGRTSQRRFTPLSVSGCGMWLDAARGVGLTSGNLVANWDDMSPGDNDALGGSDATKPLWSMTGLAGLPSVQFDGNDDYLTAHSAAGLLSGDDTPFTIVALLAADSSAGTAGFQGATEAVTGNTIWKACRRANAIKITCKSGASKDVLATGDYLTAAHVVAIVNSGGYCHVYRNGIKIGEGDVDVNAASLNYFWIGRTYGNSMPTWKGHIAQLLVYTQALGDAPRGRIEAYLKRRYGIQ